MPTIIAKTATGADAGKFDLPDAIFGIEPNGAVMHQVVTAQLAARRAGTQSTKTRAEVRGGAAKPWRQKGTGRARAGSANSPNWRGGGVAHAPKPRSYAQRTPKKMVRLALRSALSDRAADGKVMVVEDLGLDSPRTKDAIALLEALGVEGRVLVVLSREAEPAWLSFRNLANVHTVSVGELNAFDVLVSDVVIFAKDAVPVPSEGSADVAKTTRAAVKQPAKPPAKPEPGPKAVAAAEATADEADDEGATVGGVEAAAGTADSPFGELSASPLEDGSAPSEAFTIKGNATSKLYHPPSSPFFGRTKAEVWFTTAEAAEAAGFQLPPSLRGRGPAGAEPPADGSEGEEG